MTSIFSNSCPSQFSQLTLPEYPTDFLARSTKHIHNSYEDLLARFRSVHMSWTTEVAEMHTCFWQAFEKDRKAPLEKAFVERLEKLQHDFLSFLTPSQSSVEKFYREMANVATVAQKLRHDLDGELTKRIALFRDIFQKTKLSKLVTLILREQTWEKRLFIELGDRVNNIFLAATFLADAVRPILANKVQFIYRKYVPREIYLIALGIFQGEKMRQEEIPFASGSYGDLFRCSAGPKEHKISICRKVFYLQDTQPTQEAEEESEFCCLQETYIYYLLGSHENIVTFLASDRRSLYLQYVEGENLWNYKELPKNKEYYLNACKIMRQVGEGLKYLHEKAKLLHADLKPPNVLIRKVDNRVQICDFGIARQIGSRCNLGTQIYAAPEVFEGEEQTPASDIWSFGICLLFLLSGGVQLGDEYENALAMKKAFAGYGSIDVKNLLQEMPRREEALELINSILHFDPSRRPQTMKKILSHPYFQPQEVSSAPSSSSTSSCSTSSISSTSSPNVKKAP